jgi:hypothetical protein
MILSFELGYLATFFLSFSRNYEKDKMNKKFKVKRFEIMVAIEFLKRSAYIK